MSLEEDLLEVIDAAEDVCINLRRLTEEANILRNALSTYPAKECAKPAS